MGLSGGLDSPEGPVVSGGSTGGAVDAIYELRLRIKDATPSGPPPMVGADGIEPSTSSVSRKRSTTEPRAYSEAKRQRLTGGCGSVNDLGGRAPTARPPFLTATSWGWRLLGLASRVRRRRISFPERRHSTDGA